MCEICEIIIFNEMREKRTWNICTYRNVVVVVAFKHLPSVKFTVPMHGGASIVFFSLVLMCFLCCIV